MPRPDPPPRKAGQNTHPNGNWPGLSKPKEHRGALVRGLLGRHPRKRLEKDPKAGPVVERVGA
jgi:hypothetical protein